MTPITPTSPATHDTRVLRRAEFNPSVKTYWLLSTIIMCVVTVVGIPLLLVIVPITFWFMDLWLAALSCTLTDRTLEIKKGVFNKLQSTIPLDKITDLQLYQGPIMRMLGLQGFRVETAGQSSGPGMSLVNMIGIVDTEGFREAVLEQRDRLAAGTKSASAAPASLQPNDGAVVAALDDIHQTLLRIEARFGEHGPG